MQMNTLLYARNVHFSCQAVLLAAPDLFALPVNLDSPKILPPVFATVLQAFLFQEFAAPKLAVLVK